MAAKKASKPPTKRPPAKRTAPRAPAKQTPMLQVVVATPHARGPAPTATTCGAKTRAGSACSKAAGWRTPHPGEGRCYLHGGLTPVKHGRYSTVTHTRIRELIAQHEADPDPLNLLPEIAALRALFQDFIERYDVFVGALVAWHADWSLRRRPLPEELLIAFERVVDEWENAIAEQGEEGATDRQRADAASARKFLAILRGAEQSTKPHQVLDLADAHRILAEIGKMVERVEGLRAANAISRPELNRVITEMGRVVETYVDDEAAKLKIREGWLAIRV